MPSDDEHALVPSDDQHALVPPRVLEDEPQHLVAHGWELSPLPEHLIMYMDEETEKAWRVFVIDKDMLFGF